jgi:hypothetical protein
MTLAPETLLLEDYKQKIGYLTSHFSRMWTRFNYFVSIETALLGGKFLIPNNAPSRELAVAGVLISAVWYVMGAEDRFLVRLYRHQVENVARELAELTWTDLSKQKAYRPVGDVSKGALAELRDAERRDGHGWLEWLSGWRWEHISTTRLAALFPLLVLVLWLAILRSA